MKVFVAVALLASAAVVGAQSSCYSQSCDAGNFCDSAYSCKSCTSDSGTSMSGTTCPSGCTGCTDSSSTYYGSTTWSKCDDDALKFWYNAIRTTVWLGLFLMAIPSIVLGCLPACCGKMVEQRKPLGGASIGCAACAGCCKANPNAGGAAAGGAPVVQGA